MIFFGNKKRWQLLETTEPDLINQLLVNRGIDLQSKDSFLKPDFDDLGDPFLLKGVLESVKRLLLAKQENEKVGIFGDYDADGITSASLLATILNKLDIKHFTYIPSREEGYGLKRPGIDDLRKKGISLLIAVDMGITNKDEVEYSRGLGLDTIVIDHHLVQPEKLPAGLVINPRQPDDNYSFKDFSACGLVFKLAQAISIDSPEIIGKNDLKWLLDLVAISTIADMVPLVGENRILSYFGLIVMAKTRLPGLRAIYETAGIDIDKMNPGVVGFKIAPRLNAPGRITNADGAYKLLNELDFDRALELAGEVESKNIFRQSETQRIFSEAKAKIIKHGLGENKVILVSNENWPAGLVGIVAGRIMEEFGRPTIVLNEKDGLAKGSARSIEKYHLLEAFQLGKKYLKTFGGHARAGGLSLEIKDIPEFYHGLLDYADKKLITDDLTPKVIIDMIIPIEKISIKMVKQVERLEPFGFGNPRPVFMLRSQKVSEVKTVGKESNHLKLNVGQLDGIYFNGASSDNVVPKYSDMIDLVFNLSVNNWMNKESVSMNIIDWCLSDYSRKDIN